jgi:SNF2 family DNA or RNA helicase
MKIVKDTYPDLYDFQKEGVTFLAKARSALLADDVGIGKTAQAIHGCQEVGARSILVICTASIKYNWKKEAIKWGYDERDIWILNHNNVKTLPETGMFIINYDLCWRKNYAKVLFKRTFDVLVCDEAHYLKNHKAKRAKAVWLRHGYADISYYRWMMTATPMLNRPVELHAMLAKMCPERLGEYRNYIAYTKRYCEGHDGKWGYDATGAENLEELAGRLEGFMLRRSRDVLPDKTLQKIYMPYSKEIEKYLYTGEETESIRRKIGLGKVKPSAEHITNILESEDKVVVFAYHIDVCKGLAEALEDFAPVVLRGATPTKKRQEVIDTFVNDPKCRVFIGQIQAAGEGIDGLQYAASMGVFVEIAHTPGIIRQAIGRLYREGQKRPCLFQFLLVEGTVDEQVLNKTLFKDKNIKTVMKDEELGLDFSNPKKKEKAMMEVELKRIADALEKLVQLREKDVEITLTSQIPPAGAPVTGTYLEDPPKKEPAKKAPAKKKEPVKKPGNPVPSTTEEYQAKMHGVANRITVHSGDPAKTNALFAKLQEKFKAQFPDNEHVFDVQPKDYEAVCKLVDEFLKKEGVK